MLRTKAMREKEEQRERKKYNYTLLRIRLPDGNLLQGKGSQILYLTLVMKSHSIHCEKYILLKASTEM